MSKNLSEVNELEYKKWFFEIKKQFVHSQQKANLQVNRELITFYWQLGESIVEKQNNSSWGNGFLKNLSRDLMTEFPDIKGFSYRNLRLIRQWYQFYQGADVNWQQLVANLSEIPWGHNIKIISKSNNIEEALFYIDATKKSGWSRAVLEHQISSNLFARKGQAVTNFSTALPNVQSELAQQTLKDPYIFDFLSLTENYNEKMLEDSLTQHITQFLLELGKGFAYIGRQIELSVGDDNFYLDLLFYHLELRCYVVIELKIEDFKPEHAGQINFYCTVVDKQFRKEFDNPTIGILLCKNRNKMVAEFSLQNIEAPIGVSEYELIESLPSDLQDKLPSIDVLEQELSKGIK